MFGKLVLVVIVLGGVAAALLVDRQQRLDLAAEMARTHARIRHHEQALWQLRNEVAFRTRPPQIRLAVERLGVQMVPIPDRLDRSRMEPAPQLAGEIRRQSTNLQSIGPRSIGPRSIGPRSIGPRSIGPRSIGPQHTQSRQEYGG